MYEKNASQISFILPFGGNLNPHNRWVILADLLPWDEIEENYIRSFPSRRGAKAYSSRLAFGALIIKEMLTLSDRDTVEVIAETPAMQYFIGLESFVQEDPFDSSSMVYFRKRFGMDFIDEINQVIIKKGKAGSKSVGNDDKDPSGGSTATPVERKTKEAKVVNVNEGKLIIDATCAPADIHYPTDLALLSKAREKSEEIIDKLHAHSSKKEKKPRTYRKRARKQYLNLARKKRLSLKQIRRGCSQQLNYLKRNLKHIEVLAGKVNLENLKRVQYKNLLVIHELYRQQSILFKTKSRSIQHRIVSISQPHVRPIVRGKKNAPVEFGAKLSASVCAEGFVTLDRLDWEAFNECGDLKEQVEKYKSREGYYPKAVLVDKIYRTKLNRNWCKERGIRLSGHPPGRPPTDEALLKERRALSQQDEKERNAIEGKFGQAKRRFGLARIMAKLQSTSECVISLSFLVMNLVKLRELFFVLFLLWKGGLLSIMSKIEAARINIWTTIMNYQLLKSAPST